MAKKRKQGKKTKKSVEWKSPLTKKNYQILGIGLGVILLGFILMYTGVTEKPAVPDGKWNNVFAVDIAPVLLIIGYCVIIPYGIMKFFRNKTQEKAD